MKDAKNKKQVMQAGPLMRPEQKAAWSVWTPQAGTDKRNKAGSN